MGNLGRERNGNTAGEEAAASSSDASRGPSDSDLRPRAFDADRDAELRALLDGLPHLVWTTDGRGACDFVSRRWVEYTGSPTHAHFGHGWLDHAHPEDRDPSLAAWRRALGKGEEARFELRLKRHDGTFRWFEARAVPLKDADGVVAKWHGSNTDIDDRKRQEDHRLRAQKMEALGTLAGGIAHDFNNILMAIAGNAKLAMPDLPDDHPVQDCLQEIERASVRATALVRRILAFSRQQEPNREIVVLQPVIEAAVERLQATLPPKIELVTHFGHDIPPTATDSAELHQIVANLVSNAAHAIGARRGKIVLELARATAVEVRAAGLEGEEYASLSVHDDGCGMDAETLERIFDPFFTTKAMGQGTGLGLSVVDGIMKGDGGAITATSKVGIGTVFRLYFKAKEGASASASDRVSRAPRARGERIMVVDDEESLIRIAMRGLTRLGYSVATFSDPEEALDCFKAEPLGFDAVISDVSMPTMSGFDLAREMLALRPDLPIVLTSGYAPTDVLEEVQRMGVREMLMKPNTIEELGRVLGRVFREDPRRAASTLAQD